MPVIDSRLLDCASEPEITENFNRVLALLDSATAALSALTSRVAATENAIAMLEGVATCTVTFDSDGGSGVAAQTVVFGGTATEPDAPAKDGYTFAGWYLGGEAYTFTETVTAHITLIAQWTTNE